MPAEALTWTTADSYEPKLRDLERARLDQVSVAGRSVNWGRDNT